MNRVRRVILLGPIFGSQERENLQARLKGLGVLGPGGKRVPDSLRHDRLIGVDRGAALALAVGLTPDLSIGDWDSVSAEERRRIFTSGLHIALSPDKDRSDLHFSLIAALQWNPEEILALGFTGGRPDHYLAALLDFAALADEIPERVGRKLALRSLRMLGPEAEFSFLSGIIPCWEGHLKRGRTVSVFALGETARGVRLEGFKYSIKNLVLAPSSRGLSNVSLGRVQRVRLRAGRLVVIVPAGLHGSKR